MIVDFSLTFFGMLTTRMVPSCKRMHIVVAQDACPIHDVWRLTDSDRYLHLSESLIILPVNYFCPSQSMTWLASVC